MYEYARPKNTVNDGFNLNLFVKVSFAKITISAKHEMRMLSEENVVVEKRNENAGREPHLENLPMIGRIWYYESDGPFSYIVVQYSVNERATSFPLSSSFKYIESWLLWGGKRVGIAAAAGPRVSNPTCDSNDSWVSEERRSVGFTATAEGKRPCSVASWWSRVTCSFGVKGCE